MTNIFENTAIRTIAAGLFALAATTAMVSTVHAETETGHAQTSSASFRGSVEKSIGQTMRLPQKYRQDNSGTAIIAVSVDAKGDVRSADLVRSSGDADYDREAVRTAQTIAYPATGKTRTVAMVLGFNQQVDARARNAARQQVLAWQARQNVRLAINSEAQTPDI